MPYDPQTVRLDRLRRMDARALKERNTSYRRHYLSGVLAQAYRAARAGEVADVETAVGKILSATCNSARQRVWDYGQVLKYAAVEHVDPRRLDEFVSNRGGQKGCIRRFRKARSHNQSSK